ncbi:MAG: hypothetical protein U0289_18115 [Cyclobacteriaceae bacterium]|jgi:hypothetical protein|nr:hypothetical protein [Cyclobacteriaceae bacterium]
MGKVNNNPILQHVSGMVGDTIVLRKVRGQMQLANRPKGRSGKVSERQAGIQTKFQEAAQYASRQVSQPASKELYESGITEKKHTAYVVAVSDYLNAPVVHFIEAIEYKGVPGDRIIVKATDDFMVTSVKLAILDANGTLIEEGEAGPDLMQVNLYDYTVTTANPLLPGTKIRAVAFDRPGNKGVLEITL